MSSLVSRTGSGSCCSTTWVREARTSRAYDPERYVTLDGYAEDVLAICDELALEDVIFVGHSVAAMMGVIAAIREPGRFAKLVFVGPSPRYIDDADYVGGFSEADIAELLDCAREQLPRLVRAMAPVIMGTPDRPDLTEDLTASFCRTDPEIARRFARATFLADNRADLLRGRGADAGHPDRTGRHRARGRRRVRERCPARQHLRPARHDRSLSAPQRTRRHGRGDRGLHRLNDRDLDRVPCGYLACAPDGTITDLNDTFSTWTGLQRDELVGRRRFVELLSVGGRIYHDTHFSPALHMHGRIEEIALDVVGADGERLPVLVTAELDRTGSGEAASIRLALFPATERRRYERELVEARKQAEAGRAAGDHHGPDVAADPHPTGPGGGARSGRGGRVPARRAG